MRSLLALIAVASFSLAQAQLPGLQDAAHIGPQPNAQVPDFSLRDSTGQTRTLQSLMGPQGLVLVFFRSADW